MKLVTELFSRDGRAFYARRLRPADRELLQEFNRNLDSVSRRRFLPHAYDNRTLDGMLRRSENGDDLVLGLFEKDAPPHEKQLIGYFFLWYFRERVPLLGIGLLESFQGIGLGRPMMQILLERARENNCEGVELTTMPDNERAYELYKKCGFKHYADVPNIEGSGRTVIERAMFYEIKPGARPFDRPHAPPKV